jgi:RNA recognition motif-containing protein
MFIGNLDSEVDEKLLYDTFSAFGVIIATPKVCVGNVGCAGSLKIPTLSA